MEIVFNDYISLYVSLMMTLYVFSILYGYEYNYLFSIEFLTDIKIVEMTNIRTILLSYFMYDIITRNKKIKTDAFYHHILGGLMVIITQYIDRYDGMFIMTTLCEVSSIFLSFNHINRYKIMLSNYLFFITFFIFRICLMSKLIVIMFIDNFNLLDRYGMVLCFLYCQLQILNFYWFCLMVRMIIKKSIKSN